MDQQSKQSTSELDPIDKVVQATRQLFNKNFSLIAKLLPPIIGFSIFIAYFYQHNFYPSFDLFQFSSLLFGAAMIGFLLIGALVLALSLPGLAIYHLFHNTKQIKEDLKYAAPYTDPGKTWHVLWLIGLSFAAPYAIYSLVLSYILINYTSLFSAATFITPIPIALLFGIALQVKFSLPKFSFLKYLTTTYAPLLLICWLTFSVLTDAKSIISSIQAEHLQTAALYLIPLGISLLAAICSMAAYGGMSYSLHFSFFFALVISFYSGALAGLPDRVIRDFGLGSYQAKQIWLSNDYCVDNSSSLSLSDDCSLHDAHVIWSQGETIVLRIGGNETQQIQIPSRYLKAIVK